MQESKTKRGNSLVHKCFTLYVSKIGSSKLLEKQVMLQSRISIHLLVARDSINVILSRNSSGEQLSPAAHQQLQALLDQMQVVKDLLDDEDVEKVAATWWKPGVEQKLADQRAMREGSWFAALNGTGESS